jgi:hypothetical protein
MTEETKGLTTEDARIIAAAASDRRISADHVLTWASSMKADPAGTRRVLASLPKAWASTDVSPSEQVHNAVLGRLGIKPAPRTVAAAGHEPTLRGGGTAPPPAPPVSRLDAFGFPVADIPKPVVIQKGVPVEQWTERQRQDAMLRKLGPRFFPGTQAPPAGDTVYQPSPNDVSEFRDGQWVEKHPYREMP